MRKINRNLSKRMRIVAVLLALGLLSGVLPMPVWASEAGPTEALADAGNGSGDVAEDSFVALGDNVSVFASLNLFASSVQWPMEASLAQKEPVDGNGDGIECAITLVYDDTSAPDPIYVSSSRSSVDRYYYKTDQGDWLPIGDYPAAYQTLDVEEIASPMAAPTYTIWTMEIKVVTITPGTSQIAFGTCPVCVTDYAKGAMIPQNECPDKENHSVSNVILEGKRFKAVFTPAAVLPYSSGDVTGDGFIGMDDMLWIYQYCRGQELFPPEQIQTTDVNQDGIVNIQDALLVYQYYRGIVTTFPD